MRLLVTSKMAATLGLLMAVAVTASAQGAQPLHGTYVMTGHVGGSGTFTNLIQFDRDGGVRNNAPVPDPPGIKGSEGLGQWVRTGPNEFTVHVWFEVVQGDPFNFHLFGFFKQEFKLSYNADGTLSGPFTFVLVDASDNVIFGGASNLLLKPIS